MKTSYIISTSRHTEVLRSQTQYIPRTWEANHWRCFLRIKATRYNYRVFY